MTATATKAPGVISDAESYRLAEFRRRAGLGAVAWRNVRDRVPVIRIGRKRYVRGEAWNRLLTELEREQYGPPA
jgi:hypothetical protein